MPTAAAKLVDVPSGAPCHRCGANTRLFGVESHPTVAWAELHTYVCERCDSPQTEVVPLRPGT